jgi:hypothetical protein
VGEERVAFLESRVVDSLVCILGGSKTRLEKAGIRRSND